MVRLAGMAGFAVGLANRVLQLTKIVRRGGDLGVQMYWNYFKNVSTILWNLNYLLGDRWKGEEERMRTAIPPVIHRFKRQGN
jgi:hypothetical protein